MESNKMCVQCGGGGGGGDDDDDNDVNRTSALIQFTKPIGQC